MGTRDTITAGERFPSPYVNEPTHVVAVCDFAACEHSPKPRPDQVHVRDPDGDGEWWLTLADGLPVATCPDGCDDDTVAHRHVNAAHAAVVAEERTGIAVDAQG